LVAIYKRQAEVQLAFCIIVEFTSRRLFCYPLRVRILSLSPGCMELKEVNITTSSKGVRSDDVKLLVIYTIETFEENWMT
jgi:hypothetical protein